MHIVNFEQDVNLADYSIVRKPRQSTQRVHAFNHATMMSDSTARFNGMVPAALIGVGGGVLYGATYLGAKRARKEQVSRDDVVTELGANALAGAMSGAGGYLLNKIADRKSRKVL